MPRRSWPIFPAAVLLAGVVACSDDDDTATTVATTLAATSGTAAPTTAGPATPAPTPPTSPATTTPPSLTSPATVIEDTDAVGGSTLSTVDLSTGATAVLGAVGTEVGVLGIAVAANGTVLAVTDAPTLLVLDRSALDAPGAAQPVDAGGDTLLALARRPSDGALLAIGDTGRVFRLEAATGAATPVAEVALDDPGVGLDVAADGTLEIVVATGTRVAVDLAGGTVIDLPALTGDEAPPRIVAIAHDATRRYGIDAATDELVSIADDGTIDTIGPLGLDATDGASLDIGPDGVALLANPG